jgi:hypothetical protein
MHSSPKKFFSPSNAIVVSLPPEERTLTLTLPLWI